MITSRNICTERALSDSRRPVFTRRPGGARRQAQPVRSLAGPTVRSREGEPTAYETAGNQPHGVYVYFNDEYSSNVVIGSNRVL